MLNENMNVLSFILTFVYLYSHSEVWTDVCVSGEYNIYMELH